MKPQWGFSSSKFKNWLTLKFGTSLAYSCIIYNLRILRSRVAKCQLFYTDKTLNSACTLRKLPQLKALSFLWPLPTFHMDHSKSVTFCNSEKWRDMLHKLWKTFKRVYIWQAYELLNYIDMFIISLAYLKVYVWQAEKLSNYLEIFIISLVYLWMYMFSVYLWKFIFDCFI